MIVHYDLFSGIGGFSLALDNVYGKSNTRHIFIERDEFCQLVLKKHWLEAEYNSCIHEFNSNAQHQGLEGGEQNKASRYIGQCSREYGDQTQIILTGGFPCQPFSTAGQRKGTADDRYLWPAMFESIKLIRPDWIIAENVAGLVSWSEGLVLEQVCADLESEGYEVQPFIIPACAVNAPHRRDRVWIVANTINNRSRGAEPRINGSQNSLQEIHQQKNCATRESERTDNNQQFDKHDRWKQNWIEVATRFCRVDDGIPRRLDRNPRLKALGNAIVPQVAEEIFSKIQLVSQNALRESGLTNKE